MRKSRRKLACTLLVEMYLNKLNSKGLLDDEFGHGQQFFDTLAEIDKINPKGKLNRLERMRRILL